MAHFLNRMAERALGVAPLAQPFVPAMFNPVFGLVARQAPGDSGPGPHAGAFEPPPADATPSAAANPTPTPSMPQPPPAFTSTTQPQTTPSSPPEPLFAAAWPLIRSAAPQASVPNESRDSQPEQIRTHPSIPIPASTAPLLPDHEPRLETSRGAAAESAVPPQLSHSPSSLSRPVISLPASPVAAPRRGLAAELEPPSRIVRVTIGRVDVRAQFPAAPQPPAVKSARPPALSLDEYLKQRREGKR
jgi:hypothetical protein